MPAGCLPSLDEDKSQKAGGEFQCFHSWSWFDKCIAVKHRSNYFIECFVCFSYLHEVVLVKLKCASQAMQ